MDKTLLKEGEIFPRLNWLILWNSESEAVLCKEQKKVKFIIFLHILKFNEFFDLCLQKKNATNSFESFIFTNFINLLVINTFFIECKYGKLIIRWLQYSDFLIFVEKII